MTQARNYVKCFLFRMSPSIHFFLVLGTISGHGSIVKYLSWSRNWLSSYAFFFHHNIEIHQIFIINIENNTCFHMTFLDYIPWFPTRQNPIYWLDIEDEPHSPRWWKKFLCLPNGNSILFVPGHLLKITAERNGIYSSWFPNLKYFSRFCRMKTKEIVLFHWKWWLL